MHASPSSLSSASSPSSLHGQRALVIGGSSGIGLACALALADAGAEVRVASRSADKLAAARADSGDRLATAVLDGSDEAQVRDFFAAQPPFHHLVLCANAGGAIGRFETLETSALRSYFDNKLWVYLAVLRHAAQRQVAGGSITLVNGGASRFGVPGMGALAVVNGGLDALIRPLAIERAPTRVNAVAPGLIATPYWGRMDPQARQRMYDSGAAGVPAGRVGQAADVASTVVFLAGNSFITGQVIDVDGGRHLNPLLAPMPAQAPTSTPAR